MARLVGRNGLQAKRVEEIRKAAYFKLREASTGMHNGVAQGLTKGPAWFSCMPGIFTQPDIITHSSLRTVHSIEKGGQPVYCIPPVSCLSYVHTFTQGRIIPHLLAKDCIT